MWILENFKSHLWLALYFEGTDSAGLRYRKGSVEEPTQLLGPILYFLSLPLYRSQPEAGRTVYCLVTTTSPRRSHKRSPVSLFTDLSTHGGVR